MTGTLENMDDDIGSKIAEYESELKNLQSKRRDIQSRLNKATSDFAEEKKFYDIYLNRLVTAKKTQAVYHHNPVIYESNKLMRNQAVRGAEDDFRPYEQKYESSKRIKENLESEVNQISTQIAQMERKIADLEGQETRRRVEAQKQEDEVIRSIHSGATVESLVECGYQELMLSNWAKAGIFFDQARSISPSYAPLWVGKLCAELKVQHEEELANYHTPFTANTAFKMAVRYADDNYKERLIGYNGAIIARIAEKERIATAEAERKRRAAEEAARKRQEQEKIDAERKRIAAEAEVQQKYGFLLERFSVEGKAQAEQRWQAAQAQLDEENKKAQAEVEAKNAQILQEHVAVHNAWKDECLRVKAAYDTAYKNWEAETNAIKAQAAQWNAQGLCPHDGGTLKGLFAKKCSKCGKLPIDLIRIPAAPAQPNYPTEPKMPQLPTFTPRSLEAVAVDVVATIKGEFVFVKLADIDWRVLTVENNKALLISEKILEKRPYNVKYKDVTWETCTLRQYLNGEFYNSLGSVRSAIVETRNSNPNNPWYGTAGGNATTDKVFLLSLDEVVKYFGDSGDLANKRRKNSSGNLKSDGLWLHDQYNSMRIAKYGNGTDWWWLRSPGTGSGNAARVYYDGGVYVGGNGVPEDDIGVRPAMWLNLD